MDIKQTIETFKLGNDDGSDEDLIDPELMSFINDILGLSNSNGSWDDFILDCFNKILTDTYDLKKKITYIGFLMDFLDEVDYRSYDLDTWSIVLPKICKNETYEPVKPETQQKISKYLETNKDFASLGEIFVTEKERAYSQRRFIDEIMIPFEKKQYIDNREDEEIDDDPSYTVIKTTPYYERIMPSAKRTRFDPFYNTPQPDSLFMPLPGASFGGSRKNNKSKRNKKINKRKITIKNKKLLRFKKTRKHKP
jgi:hypothetical protein